MPRKTICIAIACFTSMAGLAHAQQPSTAELIAQIEALKRRVDELENRRSAPKRHLEYKRTAAPSSKQSTTAPEAVAAVAPATPNATPAPQPTAGNIVVLRAPEPMGSPFEDALRSDLPGLSFRIPGMQSEVRIYGFAKVSAHRDFNGRNQTDAPAPSGIPLANSPNSAQGGDFGMTARFSRIGLDTRTLTSFGTLETRIEGDFGGGAPVSNNAVFRLRQAWAELGTDAFRVLFGQANSLWNEGMYETLIDATNLNQSFVRQPQLRVIATLAPGLTGQVSLETPDTQYTADAGVVTTGGGFNGGLSPAFTSLPDLLARLTYRTDGLEIDVRGLLRQLSIRTAGTTAAPPAFSDNELGWGVAGHVRFPMRWLSNGFGADQLIGMAYYGEGIGRYFAGNSGGQDALTSLGLLGASLSFDPLLTYGATVAYRRFWTEQLRSNFAYSYARQDYPTYALAFTPGSPSATSLNGEMQQAIVNLIWSPFAQISGGTVNTGWLDVGLEYVYTRRDVFGGAPATAAAGAGYGVANRILAAGIGRF
ncbi:MAG: porin [Xanthobacteraceae bacterium]|nr:porin [Xanthobacteraceae bacterium]